MNANNLLQGLLYVAVLLALTKPLGWYMAKVYEGEAPVLGRLLGPVERGIYKAWGVDAREQMDWRTYAHAVLWSGVVSFALFYLIERIQHRLPLNPLALGPVVPDVAFN